MAYFISNELSRLLYNLKAIVFLNQYDKMFSKVINRKYSFFKKQKIEDTMTQILQMIFIDKAFDTRVKGEEIDNHLVDPESFRGWIRVALQESKVMHRELVFKYRNFPEVLEMHKIFMNSLYNLAKEYNTDNYITCIMYFDKLWELLSYKLN